MSADTAAPLPAHTAFIALGSNLGDSRQILQKSLLQLQKLSQAPLMVSSLWETSPVGCPEGSPWFVNAVAGLTPLPHETPFSLHAALQNLEQQWGRPVIRTPNSPRLLDLDLIAFGTEVIQCPNLILPHPRAHLRRFVMEPLAEIAPSLVLPGQILTVSQLVAALKSNEIMRRLS